jgi:hypothetical protein
VITVPNHHAIVPITRDIGVELKPSSISQVFKIQLFGDSILCGRDPDLIDPICGCTPADLSGAVPQPPSRLLEVFLPQYQLKVESRCSGLSTSVQLFEGFDSVNKVWPTSVDADIVVINHGLNDARFEVDLEEYRQILIDLRDALPKNIEIVWMTPTPTRGLNTNSYANVMKQVAALYKDILADTRNIKNWLSKLPDGTHPRQPGYSELVEVCLAPAINNAIIRFVDKNIIKDTFSKRINQRLDLQEKFIMTGERRVQLSFTPKSSSWVEIYHRDNISYRAVARGYLDTRGILSAGVWNADNTQQLVSTGRSYNLVKIKRDRGDIIFSRNYDIYGDPAQAILLANDLNQTDDNYIVVVTTNDEPRNNRLAAPLVEAMYRCGASEIIFGSDNFKFRSSYILIGIPGIGQGNGHEAYSGLVDAVPSNIQPVPSNNIADYQTYYPTVPGNPNWSSILNEYGILDDTRHATLTRIDSDDNVLMGGGSYDVSRSGGILNTGLVYPIFRLAVTQTNQIVDAVSWSPLTPNVTSVSTSNVVITDTPDCRDLGIQFGVQGQSYIVVNNQPLLQLTADVTKAFSIETVIWPIANGGGGMIFNKDAEYELRISSTGNIEVALDWGIGSDINLPGGGWYYTPVQVAFNERSHIAWVVNGSQFDIYVNGVISYSEFNLDRANRNDGNNLFIGNRGGLSDQFTGYILDFRIWDRALIPAEISITKNYLEYNGIPFYGGVAPMLENFTPEFTDTQAPTKDLVIIGRSVTVNDLYQLGIYRTKKDVLTAMPGEEVNWNIIFKANRLFKVGYWLWDARKMPVYDNSFTSLFDIAIPSVPGSPVNTDVERTANGSFTVPTTFNDKSIIVFGVGDVTNIAPTGFSNVSLTVEAKRFSTATTWSGKFYDWEVFFPQPDEYTFELSTDNFGTLSIQSNLEANVSLSTSYTDVLQIPEGCTSYKIIKSQTYTISQCGWYVLRIYAENSLDLLVPPTFYSLHVAAPSALQLFKSYAVESNLNEFTWDIYLDDTTIYNLELAISSQNVYKFEIKEVGQTNFREIALTSSNQFYVQRSFMTRTSYHTIRITNTTPTVSVTNSVAARIKNSNGRTVWSTRSLRNPIETDYKGVAAKIVDRFNRIIWTTRSASNAKKYNDFFQEPVIDRSVAYSEIEFEISPQGTVIPVDIFPPRYEYIDGNNTVVSMKPTRSYDIVKESPYVNGTRIVNHRYFASKVETQPDFYSFIANNEINFRQPMHGIITVVSDTIASRPQGSVSLRLENIHSLDYYRKRFTPARWAPGANVYSTSSSIFGQPPGSPGTVSGSMAPRVANSAVGTNQILEYDSIYNAGLNFRVGDSHYAEPVILAQPLKGYARISLDRKTIDYIPFEGSYGFDSFSYTLISQHGQEGLPKNVYVRLTPNPENGIRITSTKSVFSESDTYITWDVKVPEPGANVKASITGGKTLANLAYNNQLSYALSSSPVVFYSLTSNPAFNLTGNVILRLGPAVANLTIDSLETLEVTMFSANSGYEIAKGTAVLAE